MKRCLVLLLYLVYPPSVRFFFFSQKPSGLNQASRLAVPGCNILIVIIITMLRPLALRACGVCLPDKNPYSDRPIRGVLAG